MTYIRLNPFTGDESGKHYSEASAGEMQRREAQAEEQEAREGLMKALAVAQEAAKELQDALLEVWRESPPADPRRIKHLYWAKTKRDEDWLRSPPGGCDKALERIQKVLSVWYDELEAQDDTP